MDFALTERGNSGLVDRFWEQWNEHQEVLYWCCLRLMNSNRTDAEDALSRAALKAWEKVQKFGGKITNFRAWSIKLTRNLCVDIIRERSRGATGVESIEWVGDTQDLGMTSSVESPESFLEREERSIEIRRAIADLPERLRGTFILHFYQELTHKEIAERQGISYSNVSRRIYVAKKKLKEKLSDYFLGAGENVSVTAGSGHKLSTQRKYGEKQQRIESEERIGLETGTKELECERATFDGHSISLSLHLPLLGEIGDGFLSQEEVVEIEKSEFVDSCVELGDNVDNFSYHSASSGGATLTVISYQLASSGGATLSVPKAVSSAFGRKALGFKSEIFSFFIPLKRALPEFFGKMIQEVPTVSVEVGSDSLVEVEKQESVESAVESREQVNQKIQDTATELTEVEFVEVVEAEKDGCVKSSVESNDHRDIQKINNIIQPFYRKASKGDRQSLFLYHPPSEKFASLLSVACCLSNASKSYQKKLLPCCLSREQMRWLRPYVMWSSLTGGNTKSGLSSRLMGEMKFFLNVRGSLNDIQWVWDRSLMDTGG